MVVQKAQGTRKLCDKEGVVATGDGGKASSVISVASKIIGTILTNLNAATRVTSSRFITLSEEIPEMISMNLNSNEKLMENQYQK